MWPVWHKLISPVSVEEMCKQCDAVTQTRINWMAFEWSTQWMYFMYVFWSESLRTMTVFPSAQFERTSRGELSKWPGIYLVKKAEISCEKSIFPTKKFRYFIEVKYCLIDIYEYVSAVYGRFEMLQRNLISLNQLRKSKLQASFFCKSHFTLKFN